MNQGHLGYPKGGSGARPFVVCSAGTSSSTVLPAWTFHNGVMGLEQNDLLFSSCQRDYNVGGRTGPVSLSPSIGKGWTQFGTPEITGCSWHRYEGQEKGEPHPVSGLYTVNCNGASQGCSVAWGVRSAGEIQEQMAHVYQNTIPVNFAAGAITVESEYSLLVAVLGSHANTGGPAFNTAIPPDWTYINGAGRWWPSLAVFVRDVDAGPSPAVSFTHTYGYNSGYIQGGVLFAIKPSLKI